MGGTGIVWGGMPGVCTCFLMSCIGTAPAEEIMESQDGGVGKKINHAVFLRGGLGEHKPNCSFSGRKILFQTSAAFNL